MNPRWMMLRLLLAPEGDGGAGGGGTGGATGAGGAGGAPATFTQDQVNAMLASERRSTEAKLTQKFADYEAVKAKAAELETQHAETAKRLEELENKGKSAEQRERDAAQKAADTIKAERESLAKQLEAERAEKKATFDLLIQERTEALVGAAFDANKGFGEMRRHAIPAFMRDVDIARDEKGAIVSISLAGIARKDMSEAMGAWLQLPGNRGFAAAALGGGGTRGPNGAGVGGARKPYHEMTDAELERAAAQEAAGR